MTASTGRLGRGPPWSTCSERAHRRALRTVTTGPARAALITTPADAQRSRVVSAKPAIRPTLGTVGRAGVATSTEPLTGGEETTGPSRRGAVRDARPRGWPWWCGTHVARQSIPTGANTRNIGSELDLVVSERRESNPRSHLGGGCRALRRPGASRVQAAQTAFRLDRVPPAATRFDRLLWHECSTTHASSRG